jgi:hypothetical protein
LKVADIAKARRFLIDRRIKPQKWLLRRVPLVRSGQRLSIEDAEASRQERIAR